MKNNSKTECERAINEALGSGGDMTAEEIERVSEELGAELWAIGDGDFEAMGWNDNDDTKFWDAVMAVIE